MMDNQIDCPCNHCKYLDKDCNHDDCDKLKYWHDHICKYKKLIKLQRKEDVHE